MEERQEIQLSPCQKSKDGTHHLTIEWLIAVLSDWSGSRRFFVPILNPCVGGIEDKSRVVCSHCGQVINLAPFKEETKKGIEQIVSWAKKEERR